MHPDAIQNGAVQTGLVPSSRMGMKAPEAVLSEAAQARWYAVYTCANHEKRVAEQLAGRSVDHFLPQYESVRRWKDRKVRLQLPLFPSYLFVYIASQEKTRVLQVPGVAQLVGFHGHPTPLPDEDILRVREFLGQGWRAEPHPYLAAGRRVRVVRGPLAGMEGMVVRRKNRSRLVLSFDLIQRSMAIELDEEDLAAV